MTESSFCPLKLVRLSMPVQAKSKEGQTPQSSEIFYFLSLKNSFGLKSVVEKIRFRGGFVDSRSDPRNKAAFQISARSVHRASD